MKELFPHEGFPYRLEVKEENKVCWFQCQEHLHKHLLRYHIIDGKIDVAKGHKYKTLPTKKPRKKRSDAGKSKKTPKLSTVEDFYK